MKKRHIVEFDLLRDHPDLMRLAREYGRVDELIDIVDAALEESLNTANEDIHQEGYDEGYAEGYQEGFDDAKRVAE